MDIKRERKNKQREQIKIQRVRYGDNGRNEKTKI